MAETPLSYKTLTPYLVVADADDEIQFIQNAFDGVEVVCQRTPTGAVMHAELRVGDSLVMLGQASEMWKALSAALFLWVPDVDATYQQALQAGAASLSAPEDKPYGHRMAGVIDGNGINWWIAAPCVGSVSGA